MDLYTQLSKVEIWTKLRRKQMAGVGVSLVEISASPGATDGWLKISHHETFGLLPDQG